MIPNQTRAVLRPIIIGASAKCENCEKTLRGNFKYRPQQIIVQHLPPRQMESNQTLLPALLRQDGSAIRRGNRVSEETWQRVRWIPIAGIAVVGLAAMVSGDFGRAMFWLTAAIALCLHSLYLDFKAPND